jgi:hypothetical protein
MAISDVRIPAAVEVVLIAVETQHAASLPSVEPESYRHRQTESVVRRGLAAR